MFSDDYKKNKIQSLKMKSGWFDDLMDNIDDLMKSFWK